MKITIKKLLAILILPAAIVYMDILIIPILTMSIDFIALAAINVSTLIGCYMLYLQHKDHKFTTGIESVPLCTIGFGWHNGLIGIVFPFFVITFGWKSDLSYL
tara:strand:- start:181 stop:489 length:309 start_codon:yes stop_codon:yes gene_type:complete